MAENDIMTKIPAIVVIIGAIVAIVAFFLAWLTISGTSFNGMDLMNNKESIKDLLNNSWQLMIPLICLILAIIVAIAAIISMFIEIPKMYLNIGYIIFGLVILILAVVFFTAQCESDFINGTFKFADNASAGVWVALVGGVIIALSGVLDIAGIYDKIAAPKQ